MTTESSNNVKKIILFHKALKIQRLKREVQFNSLFQKEKHLQKMKTKIQRNLNLLVKTSLMIHKKLRIIQKHITSHIREMTKVKKVQVYIRDKDNSGTSASQTFSIKDDKTITIPLKIEQGSDAGYTIRVDGDVIA